MSRRTNNEPRNPFPVYHGTLTAEDVALNTRLVPISGDWFDPVFRRSLNRIAAERGIPTILPVATGRHRRRN